MTNKNSGKLSVNAVGDEKLDQLLHNTKEASPDMSMEDKNKGVDEDRKAIVFRGPNGIKPGVAFAEDALNEIKAAFRGYGWTIYSGPELESFAREIESNVSVETGHSTKMRFRSPDAKQDVEFTVDSFADEVRQSFTEHGWNLFEKR